jgi:Uma2 family endonuclease
MSVHRSQSRYTVEEYLSLERSSDERHEFLDGDVYLMAGERPDHGTICTNISGQLYVQLRGKPCQVFSKDMKVRSGPEPKSRYEARGLYSYPDLIVVCDERRYHDEYKDVLLNPIVVVEVLSQSTEAFDRGEKWARYQTWLPSLSEYILVSQTKPHIEHFIRRSNGEWLYSLQRGLDGNLELASVGCTLALADIYDRIVFPPEPVDVSRDGSE